MYKVTFGLIDGGNRGIEYTSMITKNIIKELWGHKGTKIKDGGYDDNGNEIYWLTDNQIKINPLKVTCELIAEISAE